MVILVYFFTSLLLFLNSTKCDSEANTESEELESDYVEINNVLEQYENSLPELATKYSLHRFYFERSARLDESFLYFIDSFYKLYEKYPYVVFAFKLYKQNAMNRLSGFDCELHLFFHSDDARYLHQMIDQEPLIPLRRQPFLVISLTGLSAEDLLVESNIKVFKRIKDGGLINPDGRYKLCSFCSPQGNNYWKPVRPGRKIFPYRRIKNFNLAKITILTIPMASTLKVFRNEFFLDYITSPAHPRLMFPEPVQFFALKYSIQQLNISLMSCISLKAAINCANTDGIFPIRAKKADGGWRIFFFGEDLHFRFIYMIDSSLSSWWALVAPLGWRVLLATFWSAVLITVMNCILTNTTTMTTVMEHRGPLTLGNSFLHTIRPLLDQCYEILPSSSFRFRLVFLFWLFYCLIVSETYRGELVSYLTKPYYEIKAETLRELIAGGYDIFSKGGPNKICDSEAGRLITTEIITQLNPSPYVVQLVEKLCQPSAVESNLPNIIDRLLKTDELFLDNSELVEFIEAGLKATKGHKAFGISRDILNSPLVWVLAKNTIPERMYEIFHRLYDTGIIQYGMEMHRRGMKRLAKSRFEEIVSIVSTISRKSKQRAFHGNEPLQLQHLYPMFLILLIGLGSALLWFRRERRVGRVGETKNLDARLGMEMVEKPNVMLISTKAPFTEQSDVSKMKNISEKVNMSKDKSN